MGTIRLTLKCMRGPVLSKTVALLVATLILTCCNQNQLPPQSPALLDQSRKVEVEATGWTIGWTDRHSMEKYVRWKMDGGMGDGRPMRRAFIDALSRFQVIWKRDNSSPSSIMQDQARKVEIAQESMQTTVGQVEAMKKRGEEVPADLVDECQVKENAVVLETAKLYDLWKDQNPTRQ